MMVLYVFAVIGFYQFKESFISYGGASGSVEIQLCQSIKTCFFNTVDLTQKQNSGLGGGLYDNPSQKFYAELTKAWVLSNPDFVKEHFNLQRWIFDNLSNIVIIIILMQIVAGIIIDQFAEMKDNE